MSLTLKQSYIIKGQSINGLYTNSNILSTRLVLQLSLDFSCFFIANYVTIRIYVVLTQDLGIFSISYYTNAINPINSTISIFCISF